MTVKPFLMTLVLLLGSICGDRARACLLLSDAPEVLLSEIPAEYADSPVQAKVRVIERVQRPYDLPHDFHPTYGFVIKAGLLQFSVVLVEVVEPIKGVAKGETFFLKTQSLGGCGSQVRKADHYFVAGEIRDRMFISAWRANYRSDNDG